MERCSLGVWAKRGPPPCIPPGEPLRPLPTADAGTRASFPRVFADKTDLVILPSHHQGILLRTRPCGSVTQGRSGKEIELSKGWGGGGGGGRRPQLPRAPWATGGDRPLRVLWTLVGQTPGELRVAALKNQEVPRLPLCLLETGLPPSCPMHKSTVCAHGVVLASGTRYLRGGPSGWRVLPEARQGDGPRDWRLRGPPWRKLGTRQPRPLPAHPLQPDPPVPVGSGHPPPRRGH